MNLRIGYHKHEWFVKLNLEILYTDAAPTGLKGFFRNVLVRLGNRTYQLWDNDGAHLQNASFFPLPSGKHQNIVMLSAVCKLICELSFTGEPSIH